MKSILMLSVALLSVEPPKRERFNHWDGFAVGSWVKVRSFMVMGDNEEESIEKYELKESSVAHEKIKGSYTHFLPYRPTGMAWIDDLKPISDSPKKEVIAVGGEKIDCQLTKYREEQRGANLEAEIWKSAKFTVPEYGLPLPGTDAAIVKNAVKWKFRLDAGNGRRHSCEMTIVGRQKTTIGEKEIEVLLAEGKLEELGGQGAKPVAGRIKMRLSGDIPGHVQYVEAFAEVDGKKRGRRFEIIDFHAPKSTDKKKDD